MKKQESRFIICLLIVAVALISFQSTDFDVHAADSTIRIYMGDSNTPRHHVLMSVGGTSEEFHYKLKGYE